MTFQMGLYISVDLNPENRAWVGCGMLVGFAYGYFVGEERATAGRILSCGIIGGMLMGIFGNIILWSQSLGPGNNFLQDLNDRIK